MNQRAALLSLPAALCIALFGFAFVAAPHSCEWGLSGYTAAGLGVLLILLAVPWRFLAQLSSGQRLACRFALGVAVGGSWLAGLFIANVRIVCRLF